MLRVRHIAILLGGIAGALGALCRGDATAETWPDRPWLVAALVSEVPAILKAQNPENGRFGGEPWTCQDQNVILPLAVAWATQSPANPYYHDQKLLLAVCRGGDALTNAQDDQGMWPFRKKDSSTWGQIHMPWTYSRWIRAYAVIRDAMPAPSRQTWEKGLRLGFRTIHRHLGEGIHNIPTHHAMALYLAGQCFDNQDWRDAAAGYMARVVAAQDPAGFWTENYGPVVGYNMVYVEALGVYYAASRDASVLAALDRAAHFHAAMLWPDGTPVAAVDERQLYHKERNIGNVGFSHTAAGRGYLLSQTAPLRQQKRPVSADYAAAMLLHGGQGRGEAPPARADDGQSVLGDRKALIRRAKPWQICLSAYCCPVPRNRWIQDRQNLVDVFHDDLGVVVGGGNTKLQPYWSTFTVGNPDEVRPRPGDANPDFTPRTDLRWVPTRSALDSSPARPALELVYHDHVGRVSVEPVDHGVLRLTYEAITTAGRRFEAHVPFLKRQGRIRFASGRCVYLTDQPVALGSAQTGAWFEWDGLHAEIPAGARLLWPACQYNPYTKDGSAPLANAKLVMILPFSEEVRRYQVSLSRVAAGPQEGTVYEARRLSVASQTDTRLRAVDEPAAVLLAASRPGDAMTFVLPVPTSGTYELLADFVMLPSHGIAQVSLDGTPVGEPFDAYAPEPDVSGPVSMGEMLVSAGKHELGVTVTGKNPRAGGCAISVRSFRLRPVVPTQP